MAKTYKYSTEIAQFNDCPPAPCNEINVNAFRFTFEDPSHPDNFKPVLLIAPERINDSTFAEEEKKCIGYALSLFNELEKAKKALTKLHDRNPEFPNCVSEIMIDMNDGKGTEPSNRGHFTFFEYIGTDFYNKIVRIEKLNP